MMNHLLAVIPLLFSILSSTLMPASAGSASFVGPGAANFFPEPIERNFDFLALPNGAGPLIIGGALTGEFKASQILNRFIVLAGGEKANILLVLSGYETQAQMSQFEKEFRLALPDGSHVINAPEGATDKIEIQEGITGIILAGEDASRIPVEALQPVRAGWAAGHPLMTINAASAVAGVYFIAQTPNPDDEITAREGTQNLLLTDKIRLRPGLGIVKFNIEPQLMENNHWARMVSLGYHNPANVVFGLGSESAVEITQKGARAVGENPVIALDLRQAQLNVGTDQVIKIADCLMDVFAPSDRIEPSSTHTDTAFLHMALPGKPSDTPTPSPSTTPIGPEATGDIETVVSSTIASSTTKSKSALATPTRTPRPTPTIIMIVEPTDSRLLRSMLGLATAALVIVLVGVWLIRRQE